MELGQHLTGDRLVYLLQNEMTKLNLVNLLIFLCVLSGNGVHFFM